MSGSNLVAASDLLRLLADPNRVRLLSLLAEEELTVAEVTRVTRMTQSRASTHLARLREAGLVRDRREGSSAYYALNDGAMPPAARAVWLHLRENVADPILEEDRARMRRALAERRVGSSWADSVAGKMDRHYAPGRTWEATAWAALGLARLGDVLDVASGDGVIAELLAPRSRTVTCIDRSERVARAGRRRLRHCRNVRFEQGDMHALPFKDACFDQALLMHALTFARDPRLVLAEAARVLKPAGTLVAATLKSHRYRAEVEPYDHVSQGFEPKALERDLVRAGFAVDLCAVTSQERRRPYFEVITVHARRAASPARSVRTGNEAVARRARAGNGTGR